MRYLLRLILANPTLLFTTVAVVVVVAAIVGFIWSERRARALAELADDPELATGQRRRLIGIALVTVAVLAFAGWWSFVRIHTEPQRFVVAIAVDGHWWDDDPGAEALAAGLAEQLERVGLESVGDDPEVRAILREAGDDPEAQLAAARRLEARWLIRGRVRVDKVIALELAEFSDYVMAAELELVDSETGEVFAIPDTPMRMFLWGRDPGDAVALNGNYVVDRLTMPLIATLGAREPLLVYAEDRTKMTTEEAMLASALERLFARTDSYARGLAQREKDREQARAREPKNHAKLPSTRISEIFAEEYFIGAAHDGRLILLTEPKHVGVVPEELGYTVTSEGEALVLATPDGRERDLLFEHYNFYSAPEVSADGRVVWTTVANHGASKSLATIDVDSGEFRPVLSHPTDYLTSPIPAPDGSRALFYSRPGRYAETAIEIVDRDGGGRRVLIQPDEPAGIPSWAPDGRTIYVPYGSWQRIVAIDVESAELRHVLGASGEVETEAETKPEAAPEGEPPPPDPATTSRFLAVSVGHDGGDLYLLEQALDGRRWLGRLDLDAPPPPEPTEPAPEPAPAPAYVRLAELEGHHVRASPTGPTVAVEVSTFTAPGDPAHDDREIIVFGPDPGQLRALTLNAVDDELAGWSRDGRSVFTLQRDRDPGSDRNPVVRVYRHDL